MYLKLAPARLTANEDEAQELEGLRLSKPCPCASPVKHPKLALVSRTAIKCKPNGHGQFDGFLGSTISKFGLNVSKNENNSFTFSACPVTLIWPDRTASGNVMRRNMIPSRVSRVNVSEASAAASCLFTT